jgi:hypothetical protein
VFPLARSWAEREVERRPGVGLALGPDLAAVALDDPADDGQADAGSLEVRRGVQALEGDEQLAAEAGVEPSAGLRLNEGASSPSFSFSLCWKLSLG